MKNTEAKYNCFGNFPEFFTWKICLDFEPKFMHYLTPTVFWVVACPCVKHGQFLNSMHVPIFKREIPRKIFDCNETLLFGLRDVRGEGVIFMQDITIKFDHYISCIYLVHMKTVWLQNPVGQFEILLSRFWPKRVKIVTFDFFFFVPKPSLWPKWTLNCNY